MTNTNTASVYFESGRLPMKTVRYFRIFKFWFEVLCSENCIIKNVIAIYITTARE